MASETDEKVLENDTEKWERKPEIKEKPGLAKPEDILDKAYLFVDGNLRIIRSLPWVVGAVGVLIIARRTHAFTIFRHNSEVPREYLTKGVKLRGRVASICEDNSLKVQHLPLLWKSRVKPVAGTDAENCLDLSLCGVKCLKGGKEMMNKTLLSNEIIFTAFGHDKDMLLESAVYKKRLLGKVCINEVLIKEGLAVVQEVQSRPSHHSIQFTQTLLAAELYAQKKGKGMWKRPSWIEKWRSLPPAKTMIKNSAQSTWNSLKQMLSFRRKSD